MKQLARQQMNVANEHSVSKLSFGDILAFLIPFLIFIEFDLGGKLFASEIITLFLLPFLIVVRGNKLTEMNVSILIVLAILWLLGLVITDIIKETAFEEYSKGWAKIIFFIINFIVINLLLGKSEKKYFIFGLGLSIGLIINYFYSPSKYAQDYPWKFGIGTGATFLIILISRKKNHITKLFPELPMIIVTIINFYKGFRSFGIISAITAFYLFMKRKQKLHYYVTTQKQIYRKCKLIFIIFIAICAFNSLYEHIALSGLLGDEQYYKHFAQSRGKWGILLGARSELLASGQAILDSPLIGHGSWAKNPYYADMVNVRMTELGYEVLGTRDDDLIPAHSYLFGSWVEGGILGGIFWCYIIYLIYKMLTIHYIFNIEPDQWLIFCTILLLWDILFSPFGAEQRIIAAYQISFMIQSYVYNLKNTKTK